MFNFFFRPYAPGFRVRPHDDVLGFNIDENGSPWRASAWSDGLLPDAAARLYPKTTQADTPYSIGFPTPAPEAVIQTAPLIGLGGFRPSPRADVPGFSVRPWDDVPGFSLNEDGMLSQFPVAEEPSQPAPPQLPGWLYKLATMLPPLLTMLDPLTGRRVAISSPPGMPSTEQPVAGQWPSSGLPQQSADTRSRLLIQIVERAMVDSKDCYIDAAAEHGRCTDSGDFRKGNAAYDRMIAALTQLRSRADRGESVLMELLNHPNGWVRLDAATHLLPLRAELASAVLENIASGPQSQLEFCASMVLREWRAGTLNVP